MKNFIYFMKTKLLFIIAFFTIAVSASAQFNWGVKAGFNAATINGIKDFVTDEDLSVNTKYKPGFHVGIMGQYMLNSQLGLESGLYYTTLGVDFDWKEDGEKVEGKLNPSYLQLPLSLLYKINIGENLSLNPSVGVYFGYGLGGKVKESIGQYSFEEDIFGKIDGEEWSNRFDMGATIGLNLQINKILVGLGYDYGFMKINKEKGDGDKNIYNGNIKVSVGYLF
jgi:hypothetical protein